MQCVNCGFENIPGMQQCVRCQSSLELATVQVAPPRAGRRRMNSRARQVWNSVRQGSRVSLPTVPNVLSGWWPDLARMGTAWRGLGWALIPGMGHVRYGDKALGKFLLGSWAACFPLALMTIGWTFDSVFLAIAIAIHAFSILSFVGAQLAESRTITRAAFGILLFAGLWGFVYVPAGGLLHRFYVPFPVIGMAPNALVRDGDALLYQGAWLRPESFQRGDLVVYHLWRTLRREVIVAGYGLDRVIGLPGDLVTIDGGKVFVNGRPAEPREAPIRSFPFDLSQVHVGAGQYMILPSAIRFPASLGTDDYSLTGQDVLNLGLVNRSDVLGRVVLRINPLWRFGRVH